MSFVSSLGLSGSDVFSAAFNAWSADKQEDFQAKMASTQYQRAANDLQAAGLNRVLALGSPAAAPAGALAPPVNFAANSQAATAAKVAAAQVDNLKADTMKKIAEGEYVDQQRVTSETQAVLNSALTAWHAGQTQQLPLVGREIEARTKNYGASTAKAQAEIPLVRMQTAQVGSLSRKTDAEADQAEVVKSLYSLLQPVINAILQKFGNSAKDSSSVYERVIKDFFGR